PDRQFGPTPTDGSTYVRPPNGGNCYAEAGTSSAASAAACSANLRPSFVREYSAMNRSVSSRATGSGTCAGGDFIRYEDGPSSAPPTPWLSASLQQRTASITIPAEFGESHTSSFSSTLSGTSPNAWPSTRMWAHLRSVSHGT